MSYGIILASALGGAGVAAAMLLVLVLRFQKTVRQNELDKLESIKEAQKDEIRAFKDDAKKAVDEDRRRLQDEKKELKNERVKTEELEKKLAERNDRAEKKLEELEKRQDELRDAKEGFLKKEQELEGKKDAVRAELSRVSKLSEVEAKDLLMQRTEERYEKDILALMDKKKASMKNRERDMVKETLVKAMQQYAGDVTSEVTQTVFKLESDDLKGKLIGKEGRNVIAFERATGVSLIIDDTPDTVFLSSFDLYRRYIAKRTLEELLTDKRIQPARIEEIADKNREDAEKLLYELGRKALEEMAISDVPDAIVPLVGKFRFRTSYGQNILVHSKEVAYIAEAIAKLVGADPILALKGGMLHDLGKSMDHDIEGTHPELGGKIARKYGLDEKLTNIIEWHHDGVPQICIETKIVQIADAISAVRPGARRMNADDYIKRVQEMENIAMSYPGVAKAYALSAGREVRVFVDAATVSDLEAEKTAQEIASQIENNLSYPGEVKVNLIREKRIIEYAR